MAADKDVRILIVEDDEINRKLLSNILKSIGFTNIFQAEDGQIAWKMIEQQPFDLVITDWMMPDLDGLELLKLIRSSDEPLHSLPVIMITALGKHENIEIANQCGINGYIVKPFSVNAVLEKIEEILG